MVSRRRYEERWIDCAAARSALDDFCTKSGTKREEVIRKVGSGTFYRILGQKSGEPLQPHAKVTEKSAKSFAKACEVPVETILWEGTGRSDPPAPLTDQAEADADVSDDPGTEPSVNSHQKADIEFKIELSFDRDATKNFWCTPDADGNRLISRWRTPRQWSMSAFCIAPRISATYDLIIHRVDALVYHSALSRWVALEDLVTVGFPGRAVQTFMQDFQKSHSAFSANRIMRGQAGSLLVPKIGVFEVSLSHEFNLTPERWGSEDLGRYACLAVILHVNTRYLLMNCLVPDMSHTSRDPAFFLGSAVVFETNDTDRITQTASDNLRAIDTLEVKERILISGRIS
jgi:hypothetical protein